jgi:hypothetical protein
MHMPNQRYPMGGCSLLVCSELKIQTYRFAEEHCDDNNLNDDDDAENNRVLWTTDTEAELHILVKTGTT